MRIEDNYKGYAHNEKWVSGQTKMSDRFPEESPRKYYDSSKTMEGIKKAETVLTSFMDSPRTIASGERVAQTLEETAKFAEEVLEFLQFRTSSIARKYNDGCAEDPSAIKEDYIPDYFNDIRFNTARIKSALEAIRNIGERIDL